MSILVRCSIEVRARNGASRRPGPGKVRQSAYDCRDETISSKVSAATAWWNPTISQKESYERSIIPDEFANHCKRMGRVLCNGVRRVQQTHFHKNFDAARLRSDRQYRSFRLISLRFVQFRCVNNFSSSNIEQLTAGRKVLPLAGYNICRAAVWSGKEEVIR